MALPAFPTTQGALVVTDTNGQWAGRCRWADERSLGFHIVSLAPPVWRPGHLVRVRWSDAHGLWSAPLALQEADRGYAGRWSGRPQRVDTRAAPRLPIALRIDYGLLKPDATGITHDVSLLGASFLAQLRAEPGEYLHLVLRFMPTPLPVLARVVRAVPEKGSWRIAVTWAETDPGTVDRLHTALDAAMRQHVPAKGDRT